MNVKNRNIWQIRLATIGVFALGFIAGASLFNVYNLGFGAANSTTKQEKYEVAFKSLDLTPAQAEQVRETVAEIRREIQQLRAESEPQMQEIRIRNDARLQKILNDAQWRKFQELRDAIRDAENSANPK